MQPSAISRVSCLSRASKTALRGPVAMVALAVLAVGCQSSPHSSPVVPVAESLPASAPIVTTPRNWPDTRSHADPHNFITRSFHLDLDVDFEKSQLRGTATLELDRVDPGRGIVR